MPASALGFLAILLIAVVLPGRHAVAAEPAAGSRTIYRCVADGAPVFSDQPCGVAAEVYEPDDSRVSSYPPPAIPARKPKRSSSVRRRADTNESAVDRDAKRRAECQRLDGTLREIRAKMRSGYTARQGERLRARERKAKQRRRGLRCSR